MFYFEKIGSVDKKKFREFCVSYENKMVRESWYGRPIKENRQLVWFGVGIRFDRELSRFRGEEVSTGLRKRINQFWWGDEWNSLLLIRYEGSKLAQHIDRNCFESKTVLINSGVCVFNYDGEVKILEDGGVYKFDNTKPHGVKQTVGVRYSLSVREVI